MKKHLPFTAMKNQPYFWFYLALLLLLGLWGYFMWASYGHLPDTVEKLKKEVALLKMSPDSAANSAALDLQRLDFKIDRVETEIRKDFFLLQKLGLPLTVIAFALTFWSVYKSALGFALQKAKETVDRYYLPDEERFKREKKLLVLTKEGGDSGFMRKLLHDTGFLAVSTISTNVKQLNEETLRKILDGNKYDLILLNNENAAFEDDEIRTCHSKTPDFTMIFSFNKNLPTDIVASHRAASANFKSQIYGNLINALKYQQYLRQPSTTKQA